MTDESRAKLTEMMKEKGETPAIPPNRCERCRFFGRGVYEHREPSGTCNKSAPGKYEVALVTTIQFSGKVLRRDRETIASSFPPVWPWDHCGEFEARTEPAPVVTEVDSCPLG